MLIGCRAPREVSTKVLVARTGVEPVIFVLKGVCVPLKSLPILRFLYQSPLVLYRPGGLYVLVEHFLCSLIFCRIFQKCRGQQGRQQYDRHRLSHLTPYFIIGIAGDYLRTARLPDQLLLTAVSESMQRFDFGFEPRVKARLQSYFLVNLLPHYFKFSAVRSFPKCRGLFFGSVHGDKQPKEGFFEGPH
jgi:hypothetical protein